MPVSETPTNGHGFGLRWQYRMKSIACFAGKIAKFPIVLVGKDYWEGLVNWIKRSVLEQEKNISPEDLDLFALVDNVDDAVEYIDDFYSNYLLKPNF